MGSFMLDIGVSVPNDGSESYGAATVTGRGREIRPEI
jgi:hypothetical protein